MARNDGGPAFSRLHQVIDANDPLFKVGHPGMSLRDYFAAHIASGATLGSSGHDDDRFAKRVYELADAMLKARERA